MTPQEQAGYIPSLEREPTAEEQAIIDQRDFEASRDRARRVEAGESPTDVYGQQARRITQMGRDYRAIAKAYFSLVPDDDADQCDQEWLESRKFRWDIKRSDDDADSLSFEITPSGLHVTVTIDKEGFAQTLSLGWRSGYQAAAGLGRVGFSYLLEDQPTKGRVRKLLEALS